jgi:hypothetical protein
MYRAASEWLSHPWLPVPLMSFVSWYAYCLARGESVMKHKSPLNVLKDTYDYSCCLARSYEYNHLMTDSPGASTASRWSCQGTTRSGCLHESATACDRIRVDGTPSKIFNGCCTLLPPAVPPLFASTLLLVNRFSIEEARRDGPEVNLRCVPSVRTQASDRARAKRAPLLRHVHRLRRKPTGLT